MKKNILYIAGILVIVLLAFSLKKDFKPAPEMPTPKPEESLVNNPQPEETKMSAVTSNLPVSERTWKAIEDYKEALRTHNIPAIKELAYKTSQICLESETDATKQPDCFSRLDSAYALLNSLHKEDFPITLSDTKQVILISKPRTTEDEKKKTVERTLFYFTRDMNGNPKILGIDTGRIHTVIKENKTTAEIDKMLEEKLLDSDQDSLEDITETCAVSNTSTCKKTDPNKKDSDGDGYWDSINPLL